MANGLAGRSVSEHHSLLFFPGMEADMEGQQIFVVNCRSSWKVKIGLNDTGHTVGTRQGLCRVFSGVLFSENDGAARYHVLYVLALAADAVHSDVTFNIQRDGIVGILHIDKYLVFIHRRDVYLVNLAVLSSLAHYFTKMVPLHAVRFDRNLCPGFPPPGTYIADFSTIYSAALTYRAPPYNVLLQDIIFMLRCLEACRTCQKQEGVKFRICSQCTKEGRKTWALYCGETCQRAD
ncbi:hypothetical protein ARMGADRAFT_1077888 [Armillaria gallica]|uniref:MYND-type domain-containing protein n=1 Tax=Armillaria gallica TaxID=47427 RepID=A0A2H3DIS4_ARMGA|nr:hypothetical protein ARMGADRAFT_1077888 [Armillaria gallica]